MNVVRSIAQSSPGLTYVRLLAALGVLHSHSYAMLSGNSDSQPFVPLIHVTLGTFCVHIFFSISGYLICGSALKGNVSAFLVARIARIYPALWLMLLVTTLGLGTLVSELGPKGFLLSLGTIKYLLRNGVMILGATYELPGVFLGNPLAGNINGSLWTLPYELRLYAIWALFCVFLGPLRSRARSVAFSSCITVLVAVTILGSHDKGGLPGSIAVSIVPVELMLLFCAGAALRVFGERLPASASVASIVAATVALTLYFLPRDVAIVVYCLLLPYAVLVLVASTTKSLRTAPADYSYALYLWAYPVQQMFTAMLPIANAWELSALSSVAVLALCWLSWSVVEHPANEWARRKNQRPIAVVLP